MRRAEVVFHPSAAREYEEVRDWHGSISRELQAEFVREINRAVRLIADSPTRWPRYDHRHRKFLLRRFPYLLVYRKRKLVRGASLWRMAAAGLDIGGCDSYERSRL